MTEIGIGAEASARLRWAIRRIVRVAMARFRHYHEVQRERAQLLAMSERERRDIGITRCDALREADKPFWR